MATPQEYAQWIVANKDKRGSPEFDAVSRAYRVSIQAQTPAPVQHEQTVGTPSERFGLGAASTVGGIAQAVTLGKNQGINEFVDQTEAARREANPPGADIGDVTEFAGQGAPYVVGGYAARAIPARAGNALQRIPAVGREALAGGGIAFTTPVENASQDFIPAKIVQTGAGAILGPLAARAGQAVGGAARSVWDAARSVVDRFRQTAPANVVSALEQEIADQISRAGGNVTPQQAEAIANARAAERLGVYPNMTRGQIERNPAQYEHEEVIARLPGGGNLLAQRNTAQQRLNEHLGNLQRTTAAPLDAPQAGARVMQPLETQAQRNRATVSQAYGTATNAAGRDSQLNAANFANDVYQRIEQDVSAPLPGHIAGALNAMSSGKTPMDVTRAQQLIKAVNKAWGSADDATRHSLGILKDRLDQELGQVQGPAAGLFQQARAAAAADFEMQRRIPALGAIVDGKITPDQFLQKYVFGAGREASVDNVTRLRTFLQQNDPAAWQQIRGQAVNTLREAAGYTENAAEAKFNPVAFDRALNSLKASGKASVLFDSAELGILNDVARTARNIGERPPGAVGTGMATTRLVGLFQGLLNRISSVPGVGQVVGAAGHVVGPGIRWNQARNALNANPAFATPAPRQANALLGAGGGAVVPATNE